MCECVVHLNVYVYVLVLSLCIRSIFVREKSTKWTIETKQKKKIVDDDTHTTYDIQTDNSVGVVVVLIEYITQYSCNDTEGMMEKKNTYSLRKKYILADSNACMQSFDLHIFFACKNLILNYHHTNEFYSANCYSVLVYIQQVVSFLVAVKTI